MTASGSEPVQNGSVGPGGEESFDYQHIMKMMHGLEPEKASMAGDLFSNLADKLESLRGALKTAGEQAGDKWSGSAAESAMKHIQQLHDQTAQLAAQSRTTGNTMHWLGGDVMPKFAQIPDPQVATGWEKVVSEGAQGVVTGKGGIAEAANGGPGKSKANSAAQDYLKTFNGHLQTANNAMPKSLAAPPGDKQQTPWGTSPGSNPSSASGGAGGFAASPGYASSPGSGALGGGGIPGQSAPSSANPFTPAKVPSSGSVPSSTGSLQGYAPPSAGTAPSPFGSGMPSASGGGSANPFARPAMMPSGGSGFGGTRSAASEEISPKENVPEESLSKGSAPGEEAAGAESGDSEAARAAGAEGEGSSGMPMGAGGGGGGSGDKERQRQAWMNEDQSIWGLPDEEIGSTIG